MLSQLDKLIAQYLDQAADLIVGAVLTHVAVSNERRHLMGVEALRLHREAGWSLEAAIQNVVMFGLPTDVPKEKTGLRGFLKM